MKWYELQYMNYVQSPVTWVVPTYRNVLPILNITTMEELELSNIASSHLSTEVKRLSQ